MRRQLFRLQHAWNVAEAIGNELATCARGTRSGSGTFRSFASQLGDKAATPSGAAAAAAIAEGSSSKSAGHRFRQLMRDYQKLSKARLSALVVATSAAGYVAGSPEKIDWAGLGWTSLGTMLAASSANALNQVYEVVNDGQMKRTAVRPLPSGRMGRPHALAFALLAGAGGVWLLLEKVRSWFSFNQMII